MIQQDHSWLLLAVTVVLAISGGFGAYSIARAAAPAETPEAGREHAYPIGARSTFWQPAFLIGSHSAMDRIFPARPITPSPAPTQLRPASAPEPEIRFDHAGRSWTLDGYLNATRSTAFLVLSRDGTILVERYLHQRRPGDRLTSWSMAKTVTAMLVGLAAADGRIRSLDDTAGAYVPELMQSAYGSVPLRHLLTMSSGAAFNEAYDRGGTDVEHLARRSMYGGGPGGAATISWVRNRAAEPGTRFVYASGDTQALGLVLRAATGETLAGMVERRIWHPMGAEFAASWLIDAAGHEAAYCCINAALRDYGRLGLLMANHGRALNGRQVLPAAWVQAMATPAAPGAPGGGYGYQTWLGSDGGNTAAFAGIRGQRIYAHRPTGMAIVRLAAQEREANPDDVALSGAMVRAVIRQFASPR